MAIFRGYVDPMWKPLDPRAPTTCGWSFHKQGHQWLHQRCTWRLDTIGLRDCSPGFHHERMCNYLQSYATSQNIAGFVDERIT